MSILEELDSLLSPMLPVETGVFSDVAPGEYCIITPLADTYAFHADNVPQIDVCETRLSLYSKENYLARKNQVVKALHNEGFTITDRRYIGREDETGYHHYAIDVAKHYEMEE